MRPTGPLKMLYAAGVIGLITLAGPAAAQHARVPESGRVRPTLAGTHERIAGRVLPSAPDSVMLSSADTLVVIPRSRIARVEVPSGYGARHILPGMLIGLGAGVLVGSVAGLACQDPDCPAETPVYLGAAVGGVGMIVGGAIGAFSRPVQWKDIDAPVPAVAVAPARGSHGVSIGISLPAR